MKYENCNNGNKVTGTQPIKAVGIGQNPCQFLSKKRSAAPKGYQYGGYGLKKWKLRWLRT